MDEEAPVAFKHLDEFFRLARERYSIKLKKDAGAKRPWTNDEVLRDWRFCNVFREDDTTTAWFREHIRGPLAESKKVLFATVAFRWFNRISTGEILKDLLLGKWSTPEARKRLAGVAPVVTGAYIINTPIGYTKCEGVLRSIEGFRKLEAQLQRPWTTLEEATQRLQLAPYLGRFMSYEVATDLRHTSLLRDAPDVGTWASAGPGCARGLGWTMYGDPKVFNYGSDAHQRRMQLAMQAVLRASRDPKHWPGEWPLWEMREVEHWSCEVWKYVNTRFYNGRLKQRYVPATKST